MAVELVPSFANVGADTIPDTTWLTNAKNLTTLPTYDPSGIDYISLFSTMSLNENKTLYENSDYKIKIFKTTNTGGNAQLIFQDEQVAIITISGGGGLDKTRGYLAFGIDNTTQLGYFISLYYSNDQGKWGNSLSTNTQTRKLYDFITNNIQPPVVYNWQSVPSISGKNGILTLSTLNDVNDGEPVETSDASKFNLTDDSNVSALVAAHFSQ